MAGGTAGEQHDGDGRGQQRDGQRPAADAQHGEGPGARGLRAHLLTDTGTGSRPDLTPSACRLPTCLALLTPPLWHPPLTSQCRWAKCRNACAAP